MLRTALIVPLLMLALAMPAAAKAGDTPNALCETNMFIEQTPIGAFPLEIPSHGGCVSSWATGAISTAAYAARCKELERTMFGGYPYSFYDRYPANNRADCIGYLRGFHTGTLQPGPAQ